MIRKAKGGKFNVVHCHGEDAGEPINKRPMTKKKATAMHRAIQVSKARRGKK